MCTAVRATALPHHMLIITYAPTSRLLQMSIKMRHRDICIQTIKLRRKKTSLAGEFPSLLFL